MKSIGPINSIVLSRAGESDNVYIQDEDSIRENGLCEVKIVDNQIMNFNDRSDYLEGLLDALGGVEYYINDFESLGVLYYDVGDYYNVTIGNNTYKCLMLNREINVTSGLEEIIYTDMPEQSETEYEKADKTDRKINQTYMIVDKQNQIIQSVVTEVDEQNDKITQIQQTTDEIETQVSNMYNATKTVTGIKTVTMLKCIKGYLVKLRIKGNNSVFDRLYPADDLYPADNLYPKGDSRIIVTDEESNSTLYELRVPSVLRANEETYDEYILENNYAKVIRRVNADGTTKINEEIENIGTYTIYVGQGTNILTIKNYSASIEAVFVEQNGYTDQFATNIEMESAITQTAEEINTEVRKKVGEDEVISKINQSAEAVQIDANKISLHGKTIGLTSDDIIIQSNNFNVDKYGNLSCTNANVSGAITSNNASITGGNIYLQDGGSESTSSLKIHRSDGEGDWDTYIMSSGANFYGNSGGVYIDTGKLGSQAYLAVVGLSNNDFTNIYNGQISCISVTQRSKESAKKNIKLCNKKALDILKKSEIYEYNFKFENDGDKKHIGFVIPDEGGNYKTPDEVISKDKEGIEQYNMTSILWKAVQEQQQIIDELKNEIKELKEGK